MQALDAGSAAALPDGLRAELEQLEDHGGVRHLHDLCTQIKARLVLITFCYDTRSVISNANWTCLNGWMVVVPCPWSSLSSRSNQSQLLFGLHAGSIWMPSRSGDLGKLE